MTAKFDWESQGMIGTPEKNPQDNNRSGFTAIPCGCRWMDEKFDFSEHSCLWWTASEDSLSPVNAINRGITNSYMQLNYQYKNKNYGLSVRCIKD